jgi:hypothetical protein
MTGVELSALVDELRVSLHRSQSGAVGRILRLYKDVLNKTPRIAGCYNCLLEALAEMKQYALTNELVPLKGKPKTTPSMLVKYSIPKPFRPFGSPKVYTNNNTTDEELERLVKDFPRMAVNVAMADGSPFGAEPVKPKAEVKATEAKEEKPKAKRKPRKSADDGQGSNG